MLPARLHRPLAALIAASALAALVAQFIVARGAVPGGPLDALWRMAGYFTVLTNAIIALHFLSLARGWRIDARRAAALLLWIGMVGVVYHLLLADLQTLRGLHWWADLGLHSAVPLLVAVWWLLVAPKSPLRPADLRLWLGWPAAYCAYALVRGTVTGFWPYPFLNLDRLSLAEVTGNITFLLIGLTLGGLALVAAARLSR